MHYGDIGNLIGLLIVFGMVLIWPWASKGGDDEWRRKERDGISELARGEGVCVCGEPVKYWHICRHTHLAEIICEACGRGIHKDGYYYGSEDQREVFMPFGHKRRHFKSRLAREKAREKEAAQRTLSEMEKERLKYKLDDLKADGRLRDGSGCYVYDA